MYHLAFGPGATMPSLRKITRNRLELEGHKRKDVTSIVGTFGIVSTEKAGMALAALSVVP